MTHAAPPAFAGRQHDREQRGSVRHAAQSDPEVRDGITCQDSFHCDSRPARLQRADNGQATGDRECRRLGRHGADRTYGTDRTYRTDGTDGTDGTRAGACAGAEVAGKGSAF